MEETQHKEDSIAVFSAIAIVGLYLFWRELAIRYLPQIPYAVYLSGLVAVMFGSCLMLLASRPLSYEAATSSSFMFSVHQLGRSGADRLFPSGRAFGHAVARRETRLERRPAVFADHFEESALDGVFIFRYSF
jgi:hypothetical protein